MNKKLRKWFRGLTAGKAVHFLLALLWFGLTLFPLYFTVVSSLKLDNEIWDTMFQLPSIPQWENYFKAAETARDFKRYRKLSGHFTGVCGDHDRMRYDVQLCDRAKTDQKGQSAEPIPSGGADDSSAGRHCPNRSDGGRRWREKQLFRVMLIYVGRIIPFPSFILVGYYDGISREIDEAAAIDGCNLFQTIFRIIFPISMPGVATAAIVGFLNVYNELPIANVILTKRKTGRFPWRCWRSRGTIKPA